VKNLFYAALFTLLLNGCTDYTFEPAQTAPKNEHDMIVQKQQQALAEQQEAILDNYRY
jgi:PBP1b-binding outer membrane lipoprotein LpoB